ncbi:aldo/keto reductase [Alteromonadaceae bacterium BrNp21-10]|nr:aldo/keto reductase [Alteromonadaceae bacterium BrNp21-10]
MELRTLGRSGYQVSEIGLGCWQLGNDFGPLEDGLAQSILETAVQNNINFLDTADVYGGGLSESRIGQWLKGQDEPPLVVTKVGRDGALFPDGYSKDKVRTNLQASAKRLGVESLDLAQLHCVPTDVLKAGDLLAWMEDFQQEGLIKHFGASVEMLDEAQFCCTHPKLTSVQIIFNLFRQDAIEALLPLAAKNNIGVIVRLPLASGLLSGKMTASQTFSDGDHRNYNKDGAAFHVGETFNGIPYEQGIALTQEVKKLLPKGMTLQQASLRWILDQPQVSTIIAGASKIEQVQLNAAASRQEPLSPELHQALADFYKVNVRQHIRGGI